MSEIKNGGLDQYGKFYPLTGSAVKGLTFNNSDIDKGWLLTVEDNLRMSHLAWLCRTPSALNALWDLVGSVLFLILLL